MRSFLSAFYYPTGRFKISRILYLAIIAYTIPFILFFIFLADSLTFQLTNIFPFAIFLSSLAPFSFIGVIINSIALYKAKNDSTPRNKVIGQFLLYFGILGIITGLFGLLFIYVMVSG